jgi:hypothetical protein
LGHNSKAVHRAYTKHAEVTLPSLADREWLDEATKTIGQFWKRMDAQRNGLTLD